MVVRNVCPVGAPCERFPPTVWWGALGETICVWNQTVTGRDRAEGVLCVIPGPASFQAQAPGLVSLTARDACREIVINSLGVPGPACPFALLFFAWHSDFGCLSQ